MTMDAGFKMSHLADRIRLKDIGNTEIKLIQSQKNTQKLRENLTALQTAGQTGHGSITKELPSLVSSVTTATSALEDVAIALQGVTSLSPKIKIESDPLDTPQTSSPAITVLSANLSNSSRSTTSSRQGSPSTSYRHSASGKRKSEDADLQNFKRSFRH
ncbi:hypothetical protein BDF14DRAFT_1879355 [Spinellus fusiger]|nr:hypothetical protein BDF14DRAFT_1879355 [Spinellus fusiger]